MRADHEQIRARGEDAHGRGWILEQLRDRVHADVVGDDDTLETQLPAQQALIDTRR